MFGLDHLGLAKYGKVALDEHPDGWALGAFSNVFGDSLPAIKAVLDTGRCPRVRIHLGWEDDHKEKPDTFRKIEREAIRVGNFLKSFVGRIDCRVSGFCENLLDTKRSTELYNLVMKHMPKGVTYVHSYLGKQGGKPLYLLGVVNEIHGSDASIPKGPFDFSYDGDSCFDNDVESDKKKFGTAQTFYFWFSQENGRMKQDDKTPRPDRNAWPTSNHIDAAIYLSTNVSGSKIRDLDTLKPVSDQHKVPPEGKDCKPVYITDPKTKPNRIELRTRNGQVIARSGSPLPFNEKPSGKLIGWRYYFPEWGYILADKAKRIQGDPICDVFFDGKKTGKLVPATRVNKYR